METCFVPPEKEIKVSIAGGRNGALKRKKWDSILVVWRQGIKKRCCSVSVLGVNGNVHVRALLRQRMNRRSSTFSNNTLVIITSVLRFLWKLLFFLVCSVS